MIQAQRLKSLLQSLINIYSPSGKETDILHFLRDYLMRQGVANIVEQAVDDTRFNLLVLPPGKEIVLALVGHVDTVPAYDLEEFEYQADGDRIYGLGAADMKAGCAAMIEAYLGLQEASPGAPIGMCLVVGEEETGDGAEQLVKEFQFPWVIVGEPTDLVPCLGCYSYMEIRLAATGKRVHASMVQNNETAIESLLFLMLRATNFLSTHYPEINYNFRDLYSTPSGFAAPASCEAWLDLHCPPEAMIDEMLEKIGALTARKNNGGGIEIQNRLDVETIDPGFRLEPSGRVVSALQSVYAQLNLNWQPDDFKSHSDANQLKAAGINPIILGPGELIHAHAHDESVSFNQVCRAAEIYFRVMNELVQTTA